MYFKSMKHCLVHREGKQLLLTETSFKRPFPFFPHISDFMGSHSISRVVSSLECLCKHFSNLPVLFSYCSALALRIKEVSVPLSLQKIANLLVLRFCSSCFIIFCSWGAVFYLLQLLTACGLFPHVGL